MRASPLVLSLGLFAMTTAIGCDKSGDGAVQPQTNQPGPKVNDGPTPPKLPPPAGQPLAQVLDCSAAAGDGSLSCAIGCVNATPTCSQGTSDASCGCSDPNTISTSKCAIPGTCESECAGPERAVCGNGVCGCQAPG